MAAMPEKAIWSILSEKLVKSRPTARQLGMSSYNLLKRSKRPVGNMLQLGMSQKAQFHPYVCGDKTRQASLETKTKEEERNLVICPL